MNFRFALPRPPQGPLVEMSAQELETVLLKRLEQEKTRPVEALWQLARFYQQSRQTEKGLCYLRQLLAEMPDAEGKANCVLAMGQMLESGGDFAAAIRYYKEAFALEPVQTDVWYLINNNLGFSLNQLGHFAEGEKYCRRAVEISPNRPNGFKNLGIALAGQGNVRHAAKCYVMATQVDAADTRAFRLLEALLKEHPELAHEFQEPVECCRQAIKLVAHKMEQPKPIVYRGWRKRVFLLRTRIASLVRRLW